MTDNHTYFAIPRSMFFHVLWPSLVSSILLSLADVADAFTIGNQLGETGLAALGIVTPIYMVYNVLGYGFSTGGCITHIRLLSRNNDEEVLAHAKYHSLLLLLITIPIVVIGNLFLASLLGFLGVNSTHSVLYELCSLYASPLISAAPIFMLNFLLYDFVRCDDDPVLATLGFSIGCFSDVVLNLLFVFVLKLGITGSIYATILAQLISILIISLHLFGSRGVLHMKDLLKPLPFTSKVRSDIYSSLTTGFSSSISHIFQFLFLLTGNRILIWAGDAGRINTHLYVAVFDLLTNISYLSFSVYQATTEALSPLAATFAEEHDQHSLNFVFSLSLRTGLLIGSSLAFLYGLLASPLSSMFGLSSSATQAVSVPAVRIFLLSSPFAGAFIIFMGFYQSIERTNLTAFATIFRTLIIAIPLSVCIGYYDPVNFWLLFPISEICSILVVLLIHFFGRPSLLDPSIHVCSTSMTNQNCELSQVLATISEFCEKQQIPARKAAHIYSSIEELCLVTTAQAFTGKPDEYIQITLVEKSVGDYRLYIRNSAPLFNPLDMKMARLQKDSDAELLDSIGVMMVRQNSRSMHHRYFFGFNVLTVEL